MVPDSTRRYLSPSLPLKINNLNRLSDSAWWTTPHTERVPSLPECSMQAAGYTLYPACDMSLQDVRNCAMTRIMSMLHSSLGFLIMTGQLRIITQLWKMFIFTLHTAGCLQGPNSLELLPCWVERFYFISFQTWLSTFPLLAVRGEKHCSLIIFLDCSTIWAIQNFQYKLPFFLSSHWNRKEKRYSSVGEQTVFLQKHRTHYLMLKKRKSS